MTKEKSGTPDADAPAREPFRPLGNYDWPSTSVDRGLKRVVASVKKRFGGDDGEGIDLTRLATTERGMLDEIVAPPANEPLMVELDETLADWLEAPPDAISSDLTADNVRVIVLPPCDDENFLRNWAAAHDLPVVELPDRRDFALPEDFPGAACIGAPLVVVPRLEDWFLREDTRLGGVRELLDRIDASGTKWLVGCNSWAWQFLVKACGAGAVLPEPLVFAAFDAERLHDWLHRLADGREGQRLSFRSARSGKDAFADDFERGGDDANTMSELAERSLGIPWVAWNMWRASLRTSNDDRDADEDEDAEEDADPDTGSATDIDFDGEDAQTLWVTELRDFALPGRDNQEALLVLHALLVHGHLSDDEVFATVPISRHSRVVAALLKSGMVRRVGEELTCVPAAYPAIRDGLAVAGYPLDEL